MAILDKFKKRQGIVVKSQFEWNVLTAIIQKEGYNIKFYNGREFTGVPKFFLKATPDSFVADTELMYNERVVEFNEINIAELILQ